ncbi:EscN/YscN/HrcN family type III secretion system ATPase, partial [bacterium]|nr:EscN/YscN/HrcN family type III secretion system ATPase [bacterium]
MEGVNQEYLDGLKESVKNRIRNVDLYQFKGSVSKLLGLTVEVKLPGLKIGDLCYIEAANGERKPAEVVAFKGDVAQLLLLYDGAGIGQGSLVQTTGQPIKIPVGDFLLGRLINPMGDPIDG